MAYKSWVSYGYGVCISDLRKEFPIERLIALVKQAPALHSNIVQYFSHCNIDEISNYDILTDFVENTPNSPYNYGGLATILYCVIKEREEIELTVCDDYNGNVYLIYMPNYPWEKISEKEQGLTEEKLASMIGRYLGIVTDEILTVDYKAVENGC